ncbi:MAG: bifunctional phosphoribosylaminoimidazolecarboxamide formyltransferase/IMP cyclohydrolase [Acidimicrobiia bacterium]|nr:bifunctional phosphoribosylaminoimidazolecarboxamide formyltransferase/IMP cyclohydrolase [Acidimicrobiia bacterium]
MPRALLSVHDKSGLVELARGLAGLGWEVVSSGGTARALQAAGVAVTEVSQVTGFPEMLDGRVKTLHPRIHGGILADRANDEHLAALAGHDITPIDLVVCNLYPFSSDPSVELIDVGGPTMVRAAAKNFDGVGIVTRPSQYAAVLGELRAGGSLSAETRRQLARDAFALTAAYDAAIVAWLDEASDDPLKATLHLGLERAQELRYGENPHQRAARYRRIGGRSWWDDAVQHGGKALSYLNLYDAEAAWRLVHSLGERPAAVVVKHANPCGVAVAEDITEAYRLAHECDPVSAFGGIVAVNRPLPAPLAEALAPVFTEVVLAPGYEPGALAFLTAKKNLRVLEARPAGQPDLVYRTIDGGLLVQTPDRVTWDREQFRVVTERVPSEAEWADLELAWRVVAAVTSNTIVVAQGGAVWGIGAGQQNRRDAGVLAAQKAAGRARGGACASDAFFPFRDGLDAAAEAGCTAVVQPGGSIRDDEVIAAADEHGMAMVLTGERHFRH